MSINKKSTKKLTHIIAIVLAIVCVLYATTPASAANIMDENEFISISTYPYTYSIMGTTVPSSPHSLPYSGYFSGVKAGVYTSYYFTGITHLNVSVSNITISKNQSTRLYVRLYDVTDLNGLWGQQSDTLKYGSSSNFDAYLTNTGLNSSHKYAVFFSSTNSSVGISGSFTVTGW